MSHISHGYQHNFYLAVHEITKNLCICTCTHSSVAVPTYVYTLSVRTYMYVCMIHVTIAMLSHAMLETSNNYMCMYTCTTVKYYMTINVSPTTAVLTSHRRQVRTAHVIRSFVLNHVHVPTCTCIAA